MLIPCNNVGCLSTNDHVLDKEDRKVYCIDCGQEITGVPEPTKRVLESMGQVKTKNKKSGMLYTCAKCSHNDKPLIKSASDGTKYGVCRKCGAKLNIHHAFVQAMYEMEGYKSK